MDDMAAYYPPPPPSQSTLHHPYYPPPPPHAAAHPPQLAALPQQFHPHHNHHHQYHQPPFASYAAPHYPQSSHDQVRTLFVAGLPEDVKPREIYNLFHEFPGYESSHLRSPTSSSQPFAFAVFMDQQSAVAAMQALNGMVFDLEKGSTLYVDLAKSNSRSKRSRIDDGKPGSEKRTKGSASFSRGIPDSGMDAYGHVGFQRAVTEDGLEHVDGIEYRRSIAANQIPVELSSENQISWTTVDNVVSGFLEFDRDKNDGRIRVCRNYGPQFKALSLVPVNNEANGDDKFKVGPEFFPLLHKYLNEKTNWRGEFLLPGCAIFQPFLMEWTEVILENYADILKQVEIYGAIGVSRYPYNLCSNVIKAFIELWSPLTNTLHHGGGEMSISLHDLKVIAGLPIFGIPYEEFLPTNEQLLKEQGQEIPNAIISELLLLHTQMCMHLKVSTVTWSQWIDFFYRGSAIYGAYGEIPTSTAPKHNKKVLEMPLNISKLGILSAFLALWLSRFLMPYKGPIVRPETFGMASLLAHGTRVSLAPAVLGFMYHRLGDISQSSRGPGQANLLFPFHFLIGWLGEHFPALYHKRKPSEFPESYPLLARYSGILAQPQSILQARLILRADQYVRYYPNPMVEHKESQCLDNGTLPIDQLEFLLSIRSANLPIRVGGDIWVEPYHPNRFARQFGFDQGVPANAFDFNVTQRGLHGIHHFATAQASFFRHNTHARFCIPSLYREASCTWWYCSWWVRSSAPYLGPSTYQVQETLTKERIKDRKPIFIIEAIRDVPVNARGAVRVSELNSDSFGRKRSKAQSLKGASSSDKEISLRDRDYKRARYNKSDASDDSDKLGTETPFMDLEVESPLKDGNNEKGENSVRPSETDIPENDSAIELDQVDYDSPDDHGFKISYNQYWETIAVSGVTTQEHSKTSEGLVSTIPQERMFSLQDLAKKIKTDAGEMTDQLAMDFVIGLIKNIAQLSATASFDDLLEQRPKILKSLDMIGRTITEADPGREEVELFSNKVSQLFTLSENAHRDKALLETIDVTSLKAIAKSHDEVMNTQRSLKSKLTDALKKLDELQVKVADVIEQEAQIRAKKIQLETDKAQTDEEIKQLKSSLDESKKLEEDIQKSLVETGQDKFQAFEDLQAGIQNAQASFSSLFS